MIHINTYTQLLHKYKLLMKIKPLTILLFLLPVFLFASKIEKNGDSVIYQTEKGFIKLQIYSDDIIRVTISPDKKPNERNSLIIITKPDQNTKWNVIETDRYISVTTKKITAKLDKLNNTVSFFDNSGKLILQGDQL